VLVAAVEVERGRGQAARTVLAVALLFVLPVAALMVGQVRRGAWQTVDASRPRERPILYAVGGAGGLAMLAYLATAQPASPLLRGAVGTLVMLAVCAAVTPWIKVSLHMAAAALAAATLLRLGSPAGWPLAAVLPVLAWGRVALGRHRWTEVALGCAIGATAGLLIVARG
jgi:hypothetical protein